MAELTILGIESSCDETAAAVVHRDETGKGHLLSNIIHTQLEEHKDFGGVVPEIAARAHVEILDILIEQAMKDAKLDFAALDGIAVTSGPGLVGGLMSGLMTAKAIALVHNLPLIGVNHLEGHALTPGLTDNVQPPYLLLLVSGGHTQILIVKGVGQYERLGTTIDDALGEAFDKTAKLLGLDYPGGPQVEKWAKNGDPKRFTFPRPLKGRAEPHFSYSGLKTAVRRAAKEIEPLSDQDISDLCASFEAAVVDTIKDRMTIAMRLYREKMNDNGTPSLVVAGGVAANQKISKALQQLCSDNNFSLAVPPPHLCTDNAAMIAWAGVQHFALGHQDGFELAAKARWPLDPEASLALPTNMQGRKGAKA